MSIIISKTEIETIRQFRQANFVLIPVDYQNGKFNFDGFYYLSKKEENLFEIHDGYRILFMSSLSNSLDKLKEYLAEIYK